MVQWHMHHWVLHRAGAKASKTPDADCLFSRSIGRWALVVGQVLIWGSPVDPIFADGAANLRSRAALSARIEPQISFLTQH